MPGACIVKLCLIAAFGILLTAGSVGILVHARMHRSESGAPRSETRGTAPLEIGSQAEIAAAASAMSCSPRLGCGLGFAVVGLPPLMPQRMVNEWSLQLIAQANRRFGLPETANVAIAQNAPGNTSSSPQGGAASSVRRLRPRAQRAPITALQAIDFALRNNFEISTQRLEPLIEQQRIEEALGAFYPVLEAQGGRQETNTPLNAQEFAASGFLVEGTEPFVTFDNNWNWSTTLKEKSSIGTLFELQMQVNEDLTSYNTLLPTSLFAPEWSVYSGVKVTQPILKDFGHHANLAELRIGRVNKRIAVWGLRAAMMNKMAEVLKAYVVLRGSSEEIRVQEMAVQFAESLYQDGIERLERGAMPPGEVAHLDIEVSKTEEMLFESEVEYNLATREFNKLIQTKITIETPKLYEPAGDLHLGEPKASRVELLRQGLAGRPDYRAAIEDAERQNLRILFEKNQALPKIDLVATYGHNALRPYAGDGIETSFDGSQGQVWSVGVVASIPLWDRVGPSRLEQAKLDKEKALLKIRDTELQIQLDIDTALRNVQVTRDHLDSSSNVSARLQELLTSQQKKLETGATSSFEVLRVYKAFAEAKAREIDARVQYHRAIVDVEAASARLFETLNIQFEN